MAIPRVERAATIGPSLQSMVYERILEAIVALQLPPGARLVENRLATQLGVSRLPVREALRQLEREQLVVLHPRRGAVVAPLTARDADEVYTLRITLEALSARLAAENASGDQIRAMAETLRRAAAVAEVDLQQFYHHGAQFHAQIVEASGNEKLDVMLTVIRHHVARLRTLQARSTAPEIMQRTIQQHDAIYQAIARRRACRAERLMEEHVRLSRDRIVPLLATDPSAWQPSLSTRSTS